MLVETYVFLISFGLVLAVFKSIYISYEQSLWLKFISRYKDPDKFYKNHSQTYKKIVVIS